VHCERISIIAGLRKEKARAKVSKKEGKRRKVAATRAAQATVLAERLSERKDPRG